MTTKADLLSGAYTTGVEISVRDLCLVLGEEFDQEIDFWIFVKNFLSEYKLVMIPCMQEKQELDLLRLLRSEQQAKTPENAVRKDLFGLESSNVEYKSSLFFDYNRYEKDPDTDVNNLKSEYVIDASLKTIAAFLNAEGGRLYIGVNDDGNPIGLEKDFPYTKKKDLDSWMLSLNSLIKTRFKDGSGIMGHVFPEFHDIDGTFICQVSVSRRTRPAYLKKHKDGKHGLFRRQTGETEEIGVEDMEEFLISRGWSS